MSDDDRGFETDALHVGQEESDNVVTAPSLYGGTYTYYTHTAPRNGVETRFVDTLDYDAYASAIDDDTAYVHCETIGNPALVTPELQRLADIAHDHGCPFFVDNTFATPYLCNPIEHGADLVWNSTTKWIHGHGTTVGGVLVDGGSFPWDEYAEKDPEIAALLANVGDAKTLIIHPASTTHQQLTDEEQAAAGVTPDMVRLSVGTEAVDDIIADLDQAIAQSS